jgi:hypothetical protein
MKSTPVSHAANRQGFDYWRVMECTHAYNNSYYYADGPEKLLWPGYDATAQTADATRYVRQHASYAGLVPKQFESGTIKRSCRITRRGPALVRSMLVEVAWMVYLRNDWARAFVQRISRGVASRKNIAIVALARKLLVTLWAMLRDHTRWREPKPVHDPPAAPAMA